MTTFSDLPNPDNCIWCIAARNCSTHDFEYKLLIDPDVPEGQPLKEYYSSLCPCGQQTPAALATTDPRDNPPDIVIHTKMCGDHTIKWLQNLMEMKVKFNKHDE
jgi:hypothetical protein